MTFHLEPPTDDALPENTRLQCLEDLAGHTIAAIIDDCAGPKAGGNETLFVTETGCWIVLEPNGDWDSAHIFIKRGHDFPDTETVADYASADQLLQAGLITQAQRDHLRAEEERKEAARKERRAAALREELERLEGKA